MNGNLSALNFKDQKRIWRHEYEIRLAQSLVVVVGKAQGVESYAVPTRKCLGDEVSDVPFTRIDRLTQENSWQKFHRLELSTFYIWSIERGQCADKFARQCNRSTTDDPLTIKGQSL